MNTQIRLLVAFIVMLAAILFFLMKLDESSSMTKSKNQVKHEMKTIGFSVANAYFLDPGSFIGLIDKNHLIHEEVYSNLELLGMLESIEYIMGPDRMKRSHENSALMDYWGSKYEIQIQKSNDKLIIEMRSYGPDRSRNTPDDIVRRYQY